MMAEAADDLAWDYTADESSPLFQRAVSPMYSGERSSGISRRQARYLLHNITEAARVIRGELNRERFLDLPPTRDYNSPTICQQAAACWRRCMERASHALVTLIPVAIGILVVLAVVSESIWDASSSSQDHRPIIAAVLGAFAFILLIALYVGAMWQAMRYSLSLCTIIKSYICSVFVFANLYIVCYRYSLSSWEHGMFAVTGKNFIETFCRSFELSMSVFTLCAVSRVDATMWYTQLLLSFQMLSAYIHAMILITTLVLHLPAFAPSPPPLTTTGNQGNGGTFTPRRADPETDSIGPFDSRLYDTNSLAGNYPSSLALRRAAENISVTVAAATPTPVVMSDGNRLVESRADTSAAFSQSI